MLHTSSQDHSSISHKGSRVLCLMSTLSCESMFPQFFFNKVRNISGLNYSLESINTKARFGGYTHRGTGNMLKQDILFFLGSVAFLWCVDSYYISFS